MASRLDRIKLIRRASKTPNHAFRVPKPFRSAVTAFFDSLRQRPEAPPESKIGSLLQPVPPPNQYDRTRTLEFLRDEAALSFKIISRILTEIVTRSLSEKFAKQKGNLRVLDFGSGVGSGVWAAADVFGMYNSAPGSIVAVEPVESMSMLGKALSDNLGDLVAWKQFVDDQVMKQKFDVIIMGFVSGEMNAKNVRDVVKQLWQMLNPGGYLVIAEPGDEAGFKRVAQIRSVILEQFPPSAQNQNASYVLAPCPHDGKCPLLDRIPKSGTFKGLLCKFPQRISLTDLPPGNILRRYKSNPHSRFSNEYAVNFSYVVLGKGTSPRLRLPELTADTIADDEDGLISELIQLQQQEQQSRLLPSSQNQDQNFSESISYEDDNLGEDSYPPSYSLSDFPSLQTEWEEQEKNQHQTQTSSSESFQRNDFPTTDEEYKPSDRIFKLFGSSTSGIGLDRQTYTFDRLLRKPLKRRGHIILDTCSHRERIERRIVSRSHGADRYKQAKKSLWGDLWGWE